VNILQVANGFPPVDRGGVESYTLALSKALRSLGHWVTVFCREPGEGDPLYRVRNDVIERIPVRVIVNGFDPVDSLARRYYDKRIEELFIGWVEEHRPDVVHFQHTHGLSASLLECAHKMGLPFVMTLHDYWYMCPQVNLLRPDYSICSGIHYEVNCYECVFHNPYPPPGQHIPDFSSAPQQPSEPVEPRPFGLSDAIYYPLRRMLPWPVRRALLGMYDFARLRVLPHAGLLRSFMSKPDRAPLRVRERYMRELLALCSNIIAPSGVVKAQYVDFGVPDAQIHVVPHGMEMSVWEDFQPVQRPRNDLAFRFGYIGSLLRHKGIDFMIRAFQKLNAPDTELWIHGFELPSAPFTRVVHELADDDPRIRFAGPYTQPELPDILNHLDVLLIPSMWHETFSIVTREAVLAGLPVIASRMGGIPDAIEDGVNGLLLPPGDMNAWVATMRRVVEDRELVGALHRAQLTRRIKSMDEHGAELIQLYAQVQNDLG
jgi:glycosyltransferase involved in cell wall biosynthesis